MKFLPRRSVLWSPILGLALLLLPGALSARAPLLKRYEFSLPRMGTMFRIEFYASDDAAAAKAAEAAFARAEELEQIMSDYRDDSELRRLARDGSSAPFPLSNDLYEVLAQSIRVSELSHGAFDVTVGPLVELWRNVRTTRQMPSAEQLARAKALVDYRYIELDPARHTAFLKRSGMRLDLGAIGKGYAADQMLALVESRGIRRALVEAGGEVAVGAPPPGKTDWRVAIATADSGAGGPPCALFLHNAAVSTSGDSHQFVEVNGRRFSHVINPATGLGLEGAATTTVIAPRSMTADAMATALSLLPVAEGMRLAESFPGVAALWVLQAGGKWEHHASRGFPSACRSPK
jgi:thiamine biosynthesis lipoprotein